MMDLWCVRFGIGVDDLPQISLVRRIFDVIANGFEHSARRGYQSTIEYLPAREREKKTTTVSEQPQSIVHTLQLMTNGWHKYIIIKNSVD